MKRIVVYTITFLSCFLILPAGSIAQKPAIDLISSHYQYRHPEAIIDTGYAVNPSLREGPVNQLSPDQNRELVRKSDKKKRRQIGPSLDSIFQREKASRPEKETSKAKISYFYNRFNPLKIIIYITALK